MPRVSINANRPDLHDIWTHYQMSKGSIIQAAEQTRREVRQGLPVSNPNFVAMDSREFNALLDEAEKQACLFLIASAEAALRVDFHERVNKRKKDAVSRAFRKLVKSTGLKVRLDEDILEIWVSHFSTSKLDIGRLRGALRFRNWLAHGRYWIPKLGENYDPTSVQKIVFDVFNKIGIFA